MPCVSSLSARAQSLTSLYAVAESIVFPFSAQLDPTDPNAIATISDVALFTAIRLPMDLLHLLDVNIIHTVGIDRVQVRTIKAEALRFWNACVVLKRRVRIVLLGTRNYTRHWVRMVGELLIIRSDWPALLTRAEALDCEMSHPLY